LISSEIDFQAPEDLDGVLGLLEAHGEDITILSGGMSLLPMMNLGLASPDRVVSLRRVAGLGEVRDEGDAVFVGAMVTHQQVAADGLVGVAAPAVAVAAGLIGDVQVRNRGTIGGSISHADPAADYVPGTCAHRGQVILQSRRNGVRAVAAEDFFLDVMFTAREPDELVVGVRVPKLAAGAVAEYIRFARVEGSFAIVNAAVVLDGPGSVIAMGGVGPGPVTVDLSSFAAAGWSAETAEEAAAAVFEACDQVQGDIMSDAEYRREMARVHARRVILRAAERLGRGSSQGGGS
jgi:carbon-monoxide dehydrogenase medium subunit